MKKNGSGRHRYSELPSEPTWYKDAVIYELRTRSFYDSNGDGIGDFAGLTEADDLAGGIATLRALVAELAEGVRSGR